MEKAIPNPKLFIFRKLLYIYIHIYIYIYMHQSKGLDESYPEMQFLLNSSN